MHKFEASAVLNTKTLSISKRFTLYIIYHLAQNVNTFFDIVANAQNRSFVDNPHTQILHTKPQKKHFLWCFYIKLLMNTCSCRIMF